MPRILVPHPTGHSLANVPRGKGPAIQCRKVWKQSLSSLLRAKATAATRLFARGKNVLVGRGGLEPPTSRLSGVRSNHLSYRPKLILPRKIDVARQAILHRKICRKGQAQSQATTDEPAARMFRKLKRYEDGPVRYGSFVCCLLLSDPRFKQA